MLDRLTRIMLAVAAAWAIGLVVAALTVPFYSGDTISGTTSPTAGGTVRTVTTSSRATLLQVNGPRVLIPIAVPVLAVGLVAAGLSHRRKAHKTGPGPVATTTLVVLGAGTLAAMLSIGIFVIPIDAMLLAACIRASNANRSPTREYAHND